MRRILLPVLAVLLLGTGCAGSKSPPTASEAPVKRDINAPFVAEDADVEKYAKLFSAETREIAACKDEIVRQVGLRPGMAVADIGAGTGLFMEDFARGVGRDGRVLAVDLGPRFVDYLREMAREKHLPQVQVVLCTERSAELPVASIDVAFVCDTYHHFGYPEETLASLHRALRPGGRLVIVEFERVPGKSRKWVLDHVRAGKEVFRREIEAAGFRFVDEPRIEGFKESYLARFERP